MNQGPIDQEGQQSEIRIDKLIGQYLLNNYPAIEHKPRNLFLMPLPTAHKNEEAEKIL
jgi:hypothetical protein